MHTWKQKFKDIHRAFNNSDNNSAELTEILLAMSKEELILFLHHVSKVDYGSDLKKVVFMLSREARSRTGY